MTDSEIIAALNAKAAERAKKGLPWKVRRAMVAWEVVDEVSE